MEILCQPGESRNKLAVLLLNRVMAIRAVAPDNRIPKMFHPTPPSTKAVTVVRADPPEPAPTSENPPATNNQEPLP